MTLHHIGIVVDDIDRHGRSYASNLGFAPDGRVFEDPVQRVKVQFWSAQGQTPIELIQPVGPGSPAYNALSKGGGLNHLGFLVPDIHASVQAALQNGAICTCEPVPAAAFDNRRVAFVFYRLIGLIEFIEAA